MNNKLTDVLDYVENILKKEEQKQEFQIEVHNKKLKCTIKLNADNWTALFAKLEELLSYEKDGVFISRIERISNNG